MKFTTGLIQLNQKMEDLQNVLFQISNSFFPQNVILSEIKPYSTAVVSTCFKENPQSTKSHKIAYTYSARVVIICRH